MNLEDIISKGKHLLDKPYEELFDLAKRELTINDSDDDDDDNLREEFLADIIHELSVLYFELHFGAKVEDIRLEYFYILMCALKLAQEAPKKYNEEDIILNLVCVGQDLSNDIFEDDEIYLEGLQQIPPASFASDFAKLLIESKDHPKNIIAHFSKNIEEWKFPQTEDYIWHNIVSDFKNSTVMEQLRSDIKKSCRYKAVLILGETGTGKELVANALYEERVNGLKGNRLPFITINTATISRELAESTIFGHKKGGFTGATEDRKGLIESVGDGVLFLDEIGSLEENIQAKLLRVMETGDYFKLGSDEKYKAGELKIIAATNEPEKLKHDFIKRFERIIELPSLKMRRRDIPLLSIHIDLKNYPGMFFKKLDQSHFKKLIMGKYNGNIRELRNEVLKLLEEVNSQDEDGGEFNLGEKEILEAKIRDLMKSGIRSKIDLAPKLGMSRPTLKKRLKEFGIDLNYL